MRAVTVGSATIDIIALVADDDVERMTMHNATSSFLLLEQGRKVDASSVSTHVGGGAVNAAVALKRLGHETEVLAKIGNDLNGEKVQEALGNAGISKSRILSTDESGTGTSVMVASHDRNVSIFTFRGANTLITTKEIGEQNFAGAELVYISNLSEGTRDGFPALAEKAREAGAFIAVNPGIRQLTEQPEQLLSTLPNVDLLTINRVEAASLIPHLLAQDDAQEHDENTMPDGLEHGLSIGSFTMSLADFFMAVQRLGPSYVVITDGMDGAYVGAPDGIRFCPTLKCDVAGTAGAGDAFASTLTGLIAAGEKIDTAMQTATINASSVVGHIDTQTGLLDKEALICHLASQVNTLPVSFWAWESL